MTTPNEGLVAVGYCAVITGAGIVPKNVGEEENKLFAKSNGINNVPALMFEDGRKIVGNLTKDQVINFLKV